MLKLTRAYGSIYETIKISYLPFRAPSEMEM